MTPALADTLRHIAESKGATIADLCERFDLRRAAAYRRAKTLRRAGLISVDLIANGKPGADTHRYHPTHKGLEMITLWCRMTALMETT